MTSSLQGVAQLQKQLVDLGQAASIPILRSAVRAGMKVAQVQAIALAPVSPTEYRLRNHQLVAPGYGARSIRITTQKSNDGATVSASLGVRKGAFFMVQFVERGTVRMPANHWLTTAFQGTRPQVESAFAAKLKERIDKVTAGS